MDSTTAFKMKKTGSSMQDSILINTVAPVLFCYGSFHNDGLFHKKAMQCLEEAKCENNNIVRGFKNLGTTCANALDSQALIELKNEYCSKRRCLECAVGNSLLKAEN
jgi:hypothetical protein